MLQTNHSVSDGFVVSTGRFQHDQFDRWVQDSTLAIGPKDFDAGWDGVVFRFKTTGQTSTSNYANVALGSECIGFCRENN